jgi:hypothetical protein
MIEKHSAEVEKVLLYIGDARTRAQAAAARLARSDADPHVVEAVRDAERSLDELHVRLTQRTFYAIDSST